MVQIVQESNQISNVENISHVRFEWKVFSMLSFRFNVNPQANKFHAFIYARELFNTLFCGLEKML